MSPHSSPICYIAAYRAAFKRNSGANSSGGYVAARAIIEAIKSTNSV